MSVIWYRDLHWGETREIKPNLKTITKRYSRGEKWVSVLGSIIYFVFTKKNRIRTPKAFLFRMLCLIMINRNIAATTICERKNVKLTTIGDSVCNEWIEYYDHKFVFFLSHWARARRALWKSIKFKNKNKSFDPSPSRCSLPYHSSLFRFSFFFLRTFGECRKHLLDY